MSPAAEPPESEWLVLIPRLPSDPSRYRVAVWRELRRAGAIQLGQGTWALPLDARAGAIAAGLAELVPADVGEILRLRSRGDGVASDRSLRALFDEARRAEWTEFAAECAKCAAELRHEMDIRKFTLAELDEEEQNVERLRRWHRELRVRDHFGSVDPGGPDGQLAACATLLDEFTRAVYATVGLTGPDVNR